MNAPLHAESLRRPVPAACLDALRARFGDRLSESSAMRDHHGRDESP
jgi:D-lactate dehydrogenase (cytochrome)